MTPGYPRMEALMKAHKKEKGAVKLAEEYLEAVYEIFEQKGGRVRPVDVARALNVAPSTVKKVIFRLREKGYVMYEPYKLLELTEEGLSTVRRLKRRHDIISKLLQKLGMDEMTAEVEAELMEHSVGEQSTQIFEVLGQVLNEDEELCRRVQEGIKNKLAQYEKR
ncbi:MAG: metal-dependent transcriptional regulator [Candidatus Caldarchaeum sp.]